MILNDSNRVTGYVFWKSYCLRWKRSSGLCNPGVFQEERIREQPLVKLFFFHSNAFQTVLNIDLSGNDQADNNIIVDGSKNWTEQEESILSQ